MISWYSTGDLVCGLLGNQHFVAVAAFGVGSEGSQKWSAATSEAMMKTNLVMDGEDRARRGHGGVFVDGRSPHLREAPTMGEGSDERGHAP